MAIKLGVSIESDKGTIANAYGVIPEFYRDKSGKNAQFPMEWYEDDTKDVRITPYHKDVLPSYNKDISADVTAGNIKIEKSAYDNAGALLLAAGLSPESDETGSWVAYS